MTIRIFDNCGVTPARYTVITQKELRIMSPDPSLPDGVNKCIAVFNTTQEYQQAIDDQKDNMEILFPNLPKGVKKAISELISH